uniref:2'-deoxynucleoside 5'-phosphate N-hydrolase 1 n=1 Tax=Sinocyclocheilus grahami TaxID=75366 RepID=A0A672RKC8_SINGR
MSQYKANWVFFFRLKNVSVRHYGTVYVMHYVIVRFRDKRDVVLRHILSDSVWFSLSVSVIVAEVTQPSLGVGYELGRAVALNKRVFCLFRPSSGKVLSAMIRGASTNSLFQVQDYTEDEVESILEKYFDTIAKN